MKVDDDPRSGRFVSFNQFPKYLTKANMHQTKVIANLAGGGEQGLALRPKTLYNCHNYNYDVDYNSIRGKRESEGELVSFGKSANFSQTMNFPTSRKAHQQVISPRMPMSVKEAPSALEDAGELTKPKESFLHEKYAPSFASSFQQHQVVLRERKINYKLGQDLKEKMGTFRKGRRTIQDSDREEARIVKAVEFEQEHPAMFFKPKHPARPKDKKQETNQD